MRVTTIDSTRQAQICIKAKWEYIYRAAASAWEGHSPYLTQTGRGRAVQEMHVISIIRIIDNLFQNNAHSENVGSMIPTQPCTVVKSATLRSSINIYS